jgi:hypothetical protein
MEILNLLNQYKILDMAVVIGIIGIMATIRKNFLDALLKKYITQAWLGFLILASLTLFFSIGLTALVHVDKFYFLEWLKMSGLNWLFSYVLHDTIKNLFFKDQG